MQTIHIAFTHTHARVQFSRTRRQGRSERDKAGVLLEKGGREGEPSNCRCVLALTYSQSSSVYKSRPIFHPFSSSVLLFAADAQRLSLSHPLSLPLNRSLSPSFFFRWFIRLPTRRYEPSHLLHDRKGEEGGSRVTEEPGGRCVRACI